MPFDMSFTFLTQQWLAFKRPSKMAAPRGAVCSQIDGRWLDFTFGSVWLRTRSKKQLKQ